MHLFPKKKNIWIEVIVISGKKLGSKDLFARETYSWEILGKLVLRIPMCLPRELVMVNLTSASRNWLFTHPYSVVTWIMSLICTNLTMILCVTWFHYGVFWLKCADFEGKTHFTVVFCFLIPLFTFSWSDIKSSACPANLFRFDVTTVVRSVGDFEGTLL